MRISLTKDSSGLILVNVSETDNLLADLSFSHSFSFDYVEDKNQVTIEVYDDKKTPKVHPLMKYGRRLFNALFREDTLSNERLQKLLPPNANGSVLLELNGYKDLDDIQWEYTWAGKGYLIRQCMFTRIHRREGPQLQPLPLRIVIVAPDPLESGMADLHLSDQFQNIANQYSKNRKKIMLERVLPATADDTDRLLGDKEAEAATVLHFMGHCVGSKGSRSLVFEHPDSGNVQLISMPRLISAPERLRLAFLSACNSREIARIMVEQGVQYTVGSNCDLPDDIARKFEARFFQCLALGHSVDKAMFRTRLAFEDESDIRYRHYLAGAMVLYSTTSRVSESLFKCGDGRLEIHDHLPPNNLDEIPTTRNFCGRKEELAKLRNILRRMATRASQSANVCTITGISGQGKTTLAREVVTQIQHCFPGGIFAWRFDNLSISAADFLWELVKVILPKYLTDIFPNGKPAENPQNGGHHVHHLGWAIVKKIEVTCLIILDHADALKRVEASDKDAVALAEWLQEIASASDSTVKLLATSHESLGWTDEIPIHLDGLTDLDIDSGVELFLRSVDTKVKQRWGKETIADQLLQDLVKIVDGHPLCLESLGRVVSLPQYRNASLEEIVREHSGTMLVDGLYRSENLETRFGQTIDALPIQLRLLFYLCSLFAGPITEVVLAFFSYFVIYTAEPSERLDSRIEVIAENLQQLYDRKLLLKYDEEYKIQVVLREVARRCNSVMRLQLCLPKLGLCNDMFVIGVTKSLKHGISKVLQWQLGKIKDHAHSEVNRRTYGVQYYDIVVIPDTMDHELLKAGEEKVLFGGLIVFSCNASEIHQPNFSKFCTEYIIPTMIEKNSPFILCLKDADTEFAKLSTTQAEKNINLMKKAADILRSGLTKTHFIIRTEHPYGIIHQNELPLIPGPALETNADNVNKLGPEINFGNVNTYGEFFGRQKELHKLQTLLCDKRIRYITIIGFGGMGKTALAIQAVKNFNSGRVLVISLARNPSSDSIISNIAGSLNMNIEKCRDPEERRIAVLNNLRGREPILFYLDNMEDLKHATIQEDPAMKMDATCLMRFFHKIPENIKVLATSRIVLDWPNEIFVELEGLTPEDGMKIFRQWTSQRSKDIGDENARNISVLAGGHPLSIRLLGGVFNNYMEPVDKFIKHINDRLRDAKDPLEERYDSVNACIQYSFDFLNDTLKLLLRQLRLFEVPLSATLAMKVLDNSTTLASQAEKNLHELWQQSWLNKLKYDSTLGDWRPSFMEKDERFYTLHPRIRDFLNSTFGNAKDDVADIFHDSEIQFYTALCYGLGFGVANDIEKQIEWCTEAAKNGHVEAQLTLAVCYEEGGGGFDVDKMKSFKWDLKAAEAGSKQAQIKVRKFYKAAEDVRCCRTINDYLDKLISENDTVEQSIKFDLTLPLLHRAVDHGRVTLIQSLLSQSNPNVQLKNRHGQTPLHLAAEKGDIRVLELLLSSIPDANAKDKQGNTPVHCAAKKGHVNFLIILITEFGADANAKNNDGWTPLHFAVSKDHVEVARLLVGEFRVDANTKNNNGLTPLHWLATNGTVEVVKLLVAEQVADANVKDDNGLTPLHLAAEKQHFEIMRLLVAELGANVNAKNDEGWTTLHLATKCRDLEVMRLLMTELKADANAQNDDGWTPLHIAAKYEHFEVTSRLLVEYGANVDVESNNGMTPVHFATIDGNVEVVKFLVASLGAATNVKNDNGLTPMHFAAKGGHVELVKFFMAEIVGGPNDKSKDGWTPLHFAAENGYIEIVKLLVDVFKVDPNANAKDRSTPLHWAAAKGKVEVAKFLVKHGADANVINNNGSTSLHLAAEFGTIELVRLLVAEHGADVDAKNANEFTPLHFATKKNHVDVVKLLVAEFAANPNAKDKDGSTPLHRVAANGKVEIVTFLVEDHGADANVKNNNGLTPLHLAAEYGHIDVVRLFIAKYGADANVKNDNELTPLYFAAKGMHAKGMHVEVMKMLLTEFGADSNAKNKDGTTPLHWVVVSGKVEVVKFFVEHGADAKAKNNTGLTLLHLSAEFGHIKLARLFVVEHGADVNAKNDNGLTPLHFAARNGKIEVVELLVTMFRSDADPVSNHNVTPLHYAASYGSKEIVLFLILKCGANGNATDNNGLTPLLRAAEKGHHGIVKVLANEFGADANAKSNNGSTPLHYATKNGHVEMVKILVDEFRADVNAKGEDYKTPLHFAVEEGHIKIVKFLAGKFGVNANARDIDGKVPLHYAAMNGHVEMMKILIDELGADVNAMDKNDNTPLHFATEKRHIKMVKLLTSEFVANVNLKDIRGNLPLHYAVNNGHVEIVEIFVGDLGGNVNAKGEYGKTPLHFAVEKGHTKIVELLVSKFRADVFTKDSDGYTPLHLAEQNENVQMTKLLTDGFGADKMDSDASKIETSPNAIPQEHPDKIIFGNNLAFSENSDTAHQLSKGISAKDTESITPTEHSFIVREIIKGCILIGCVILIVYVTSFYIN